MDVSDIELRSRLTDFGVKVGPITPSTRSVYRKKLEKILKDKKCETTSHHSPRVSEAEISQFSQDEMEQLSANELFRLLKKYNIKPIPITNTNKKLDAVFYTVSG